MVHVDQSSERLTSWLAQAGGPPSLLRSYGETAFASCHFGPQAYERTESLRSRSSRESASEGWLTSLDNFRNWLVRSA